MPTICKDLTAAFGRHDPLVKQPVLQRFMEYVSPEPMSGCWLWTGTYNRDSYGLFWRSASYGHFQAHRAAFELLKGPVEPHLQIDHVCRVRDCVNPDHLEQVTQRVNLARSGLAHVDPKFCRKGHEYTAENTYHPKHRPRERICRTCNAESRQKYEPKYWERIRARRRANRAIALAGESITVDAKS